MARPPALGRSHTNTNGTMNSRVMSACETRDEWNAVIIGSRPPLFFADIAANGIPTR